VDSFGAFGVEGEQAAASSSGYTMALIDGGGTSGAVSVRVPVVSSEFWLILRATDGANYWRFGRTASGSYQLQQVIGEQLGNPQVTTGAPISAAPGDLLECRYHGSVVICSVNGEQVAAVTNGPALAAGLVGLAAWQSGGVPPVRFDDFLVSDLPPVADVAVDLSDVDPVFVGEELHWTATVSNVGTSSAASVVLEVDLPVSIDATAVDTTTGSCTGTGPITCQLGTLASGGTANVDITAVAPGAAAMLSATASVDAIGDTNASNDTDTETTTVRQPPTPGAYLEDSFDRTGTGLGDADSGETWAIHSGSFATSGGTAGATTSGFSSASVDAGWAFGTYELSVGEIGDAQFWMTFRVEDALNYFRVGPDSNGQYRLERVVNGQVQTVAIAFQRNQVEAADGDVIRIVTRPDDGIFVSVNDVHLVDAGDPASMNVSTYGIATGSTAPQFDDLLVDQVMTSVVTSSDTFTRPDGAVIEYMESGTQYPWWYGSPWQVLGGKAYNPGAGYTYTAVDTSSEAGDVSVEISEVSAEFGIVFRRAEDGSYYRFGRLAAGGDYGVDVIEGGISHAPPGPPVEVLASPVPTAGDVIQIRQYLDGRVEGVVNGIVILRFTDTTTNLRATHYGLYSVDGDARFDNFTVVPE
jgi:hypothetical protein